MKIHLIQASHWSNPTLKMSVCKSKALAEQTAADYTNELLKSHDGSTLEAGTDWRLAVEEIQDSRGAEHCFVEIIDLETLD